MKSTESDLKSVTDADAVDVTFAALERALADNSTIDLSWIEPPPAADGWTLASDALRFLARLVVHLKPSHILEFGSGLSTKLLFRSCSGARVACGISSVDHDPEFGNFESTDGTLSGLEVRSQLAPVVARDFGGKLLPQYLLDTTKFARGRPADLVLVDGPPVTLGGREGALHQALELSRRGTLILLDDAARDSERTAISHIQDNVSEAIHVRMLPGFTKGMAAIVVNEPAPISALWEHKLLVAKRHIEDMIEENAEMIIISEDVWPGTWRNGRSTVPLVVRNGESWGAPEDNETAVRELYLRISAGAKYLVLLWPAFWWLEYYGRFFGHLREQHSCIFANDQAIIFKLHPSGSVS